MRNCQDMVFSTAARLTGNETQAEDISQEVFLKAHQHFDVLVSSPTAPVGSLTVTTNLSLDHPHPLPQPLALLLGVQTRRRRRPTPMRPKSTSLLPTPFSATSDADERRALVERALDELPGPPTGPSRALPLRRHAFTAKIRQGTRRCSGPRRKPTSSAPAPRSRRSNASAARPTNPLTTKSRTP